MPSTGSSAARSAIGAIAWFVLGCLFASTTLSNNGSSLTAWSRMLLEEEAEAGAEAEGQHEAEYEGHGEGGHEGKEEGEGEYEEFNRVTTIVCIVLLLIALTIAFEKTKEHIEESANREMRPVIDSLFGEMTVLGFLSVVTFCITKTGAFASLSSRVFGHEEDELQELFESVHFCLFFVMIFFLLQVVHTLNQALKIEDDWLALDADCQDPEHIAKVREDYKEDMAAGSGMSGGRHKRYAEELLLFHGLRDEFIKDRSLEPPFLPNDGPSRLPEDFNFGRYLSICIGHALGHSVHVNGRTWALFAIFSLVFYGIWLAADYNLEVLAWIWVAVAWIIVGLNDRLARKLIRTRNAFAPEILSQGYGQNGSHTEETSLLAEDGLGALPGWCKIDLDDYMSKRSWVKRMLYKKKPNRQDALFFFEKKGPHYITLSLQAGLIYVSLYAAILVLIFLPVMYKRSVGEFIVYIIVAIIPLLIKEVRAPKRLIILSQVSSMGALRKQHAISTVIREDKTENIVRSFLVICYLNRAAEAGFPKRANVGKGRHGLPFSKAMEKDILQTFDHFDHSGDGYIENEELGALMAQIGTPLSPEKLDGMVAALDEDNDGKVSKDEFLRWYAGQIGDDTLTIEEQVHIIFNMFDKDGEGEISIEEFKTTLDAFKVEFTVDQVAELVEELDENDTGSIGVKEFKELMEKYQPREFHSLPRRH